MTTPVDTMKAAVFGIPFDPNKKPSREGVVKAFAEMQEQLEGVQAGAYVRANLTGLNLLTDVEHSAMAWVTNDIVTANNGIYENTGPTGAAVWARRLDIPQFFITGTNTGAGSSNNLLATTDLPIPVQDGRAMISVNVILENANDGVTVRFNGGAFLTVLNNNGTAIKSRTLRPDQIVIGVIEGLNFRLITDQTSQYQLQLTIAQVESLRDQAAASAAASAASAALSVWAKDIALGAASDAVSQSNVPVYATITGLASITVPVGINGIRVNGRSAAGDGGGGDFVWAGGAEPSVAPIDKFQSAGGIWWKRYVDVTEKPILIIGDGQSNIMLTPSYAWFPPRNCFHWNWDGFTPGAATAVGTAFAPMPQNRVGAAMSFAAEVARNNPTRKVYLVNIGMGDMAISHWLPGTSAPDMYAALKNNVVAALAVINESVELIHFRWQGETDGYANNTNYLTNFGTYRNRLLAESWYPPDTPMINMGLSEYVTDGTGTLGRYNRYLAWASSIYPDYMLYVHTSIIGTSFWEPSDGGNKIHMTADGYRRAGILAYNNWSKGIRRSLNFNSFADPLTGYLLTQKPAFLARRQTAVTGNVLVTNYVTPDFNLGNYFNPVTGLFTAPLPGLYLFSYKAGIQASGGSLILNLSVGGANYPGSQVIAAGAFNTAQHTMLTYLTPGVTVGLRVSSGVTVADANGLMLSGHLIG